MTILPINRLATSVGLACAFLTLAEGRLVAAPVLVFADSFDAGGGPTEPLNSDVRNRQTGLAIEKDGPSDWREEVAGNLAKSVFQLGDNRLVTSMGMNQPGQRGRLAITPDIDLGAQIAGKQWELRAKIRLEFIGDGDSVRTDGSPHDTDLRFILANDRENVVGAESANWSLSVRFTFVYDSPRAQWYLRPLVTVDGQYIPNLPDLRIAPEEVDDAEGGGGFFTPVEELVITVDEENNHLSIRVGDLVVLEELGVEEALRGDGRFVAISAALGGNAAGSTPLRHAVDDFSISLVD